MSGTPIKLDAHVPAGPITEKWDRHKFEMKLVNPANKRKHTIIVVGTGLAGASAAASLAGVGYNVKAFCFQDSPGERTALRHRGHQRGQELSERRRQRLSPVLRHGQRWRLPQPGEANRLSAQAARNIIDQCVAQGVPFAREYGGLLANRTFGGVQVSRTFYARGARRASNCCSWRLRQS